MSSRVGRTDGYGIVGLVSCIAGIGMAWLLQDDFTQIFSLAVIVYVRDLVVQRHGYCVVST